MKKINKYGLTFYSDFKLLPKDFIAITLFGRVYSNLTYNELVKYLNTYRGKLTANHEYIHILQAKTFKTKWLGFYITYLFYWIKNLFKYGVKGYLAYNYIPFELEAVFNQHDFAFSLNDVDWRKYRINE